jgi:predicted DNA-binding ribbon-helix-helix protein
MKIHSVIFPDGHKASISSEPIVWAEFKRMAAYRDMSLWELVTEVRAANRSDNLSSAIRQFVFADLQRRLADLEVRAGIRLPPKPHYQGGENVPVGLV